MKATAEFVLKPTPLTRTTVPCGPQAGLKPVIDSVTTKLGELVPVPAGVVTEIGADVAPFGIVAVSVVGETKVTEGEVSEPNLTFAPGTKLLPVIVTAVPVIPDAGVKPLTAGGPYAYRSLAEVALVSPALVTVASTTPVASGGATACSRVGDT